MVDEIDTLQLDSAYRPRLEIVMDHYFKFDFWNRAVVSATLIPFSNPQFSKESILKIKCEKQPSRRMGIRYSNYVEDAAIAEITDKLVSTSDKILVAYNSLDGIFNIIDQLDIDKTDCGILCSERSSEKVTDYKDVSDKAIDGHGNLKYRVTFITCAYFAGIDILDKCHLIIISSKNTAYTYLSVGKITQIAGRGRNGNLSETIIYDIPSIREYNGAKTIDDYKASLLTRTVKYINFLNSTLELVASDGELKPMGDFILSFMSYLSKSKPTSYDYPISIIRQETINNTFVPAYFNIDTLLDKWHLRHTLYSTESGLENALKEDGQIVEVLQPYLVKEDEHVEIDKTQRKEKTKIKRNEILSNLKQDLINWKNGHGNNMAFQAISSNIEKRMQDTIMHSFMFLHPFYPTEELIDFLIEGYKLGKGFKNVHNAAVFHALPLDNTFKAKVYLKYGCKEDGTSDIYITSEQRINIIEECLIETFKIVPRTHRRNLGELASSCLKFHVRRRDLLCRPDGFNPKELPAPLMAIPDNLFNINIFQLPLLADKS